MFNHDRNDLTILPRVLLEIFFTRSSAMAEGAFESLPPPATAAPQGAPAAFVEDEHALSLHEDAFFCRVCGGSTPGVPLLAPCACTGALAHAHLACLQRVASAHLPNDTDHDVPAPRARTLTGCAARIAAPGADARAACDVCRAPLAVTCQYTFAPTTESLLAPASIAALLDAAALTVLALFSVLYALALVLTIDQSFPPGTAEGPFIFVLGSPRADAAVLAPAALLAAAAAAAALPRAGARWRLINSTIKLSLSLPPNAAADAAAAEAGEEPAAGELGDGAGTALAPTRSYSSRIAPTAAGPSLSSRMPVMGLVGAATAQTAAARAFEGEDMWGAGGDDVQLPIWHGD